MANIRTLNEGETNQVFGETIGAMAAYEWLQARRAANEPLLLPGVEVKPQGRRGLSVGEEARLTTDIHHSIILQLGYLSFVVPWERYRKLTDVGAGEAEASTVFGLDGYSDLNGDVLRAVYPGTTITTWTVAARDHNRAYWLASKLRNALAHGQVNWVLNPNNNMEEVVLYNVPEAYGALQPADFVIQMPVAQFIKLLVTHALVQFVAKVTAGERYEPLYTMIAKYRLDGPIIARQ